MGGLLVIAGGHPPVFFQSADKTLDNITLFICVPVYLGRQFVALSERNYRLQSGFFNLPPQCLAVVSLVAYHRLCPAGYGMRGKFRGMLAII